MPDVTTPITKIPTRTSAQLIPRAYAVTTNRVPSLRCTPRARATPLLQSPTPLSPPRYGLVVASVDVLLPPSRPFVSRAPSGSPASSFDTHTHACTVCQVVELDITT